tara:strand:+ start:11353 stop:11871 length:519 start_codon:yes stop_codon:yes gene_type:complete
MSCCSFNGQEGGGNNPQAEIVTEEMLEWVRASGDVCPPDCGPEQQPPGTMQGRSLPKNFGDIPGMGNPNARGVDPTIFNPNDPDGQHRSAAAGDPWYTTLQGRSAINTSALQPRPDHWSPHGRTAPFDWTTRGGTNFDGGAVKKNWIPLVVLGLSLVVGIGLSEWATKKYIK